MAFHEIAWPLVWYVSHPRVLFRYLKLGIGIGDNQVTERIRHMSYVDQNTLIIQWSSTACDMWCQVIGSQRKTHLCSHENDMETMEMSNTVLRCPRGKVTDLGQFRCIGLPNLDIFGTPDAVVWQTPLNDDYGPTWDGQFERQHASNRLVNLRF